MSDFHSTTGALPAYPDDLTVPQFFLDAQHPSRPVRNGSIPWMIEDATGRNIGFEEVSNSIQETTYAADTTRLSFEHGPLVWQTR